MSTITVIIPTWQMEKILSKVVYTIHFNIVKQGKMNFNFLEFLAVTVSFKTESCKYKSEQKELMCLSKEV